MKMNPLLQHHSIYTAAPRYWKDSVLHYTPLPNVRRTKLGKAPSSFVIISYLARVFVQIFSRQNRSNSLTCWRPGASSWSTGWFNWHAGSFVTSSVISAECKIKNNRERWKLKVAAIKTKWQSCLAFSQNLSSKVLGARVGVVKNDPNHEDLRKQKDTKTHFLNK